MGCTFKATCRDCRLNFEASEGGGFFFHQLQCDRCAEVKAISFEEIGEPHLKYLKGLPGPYCIASSKSDENVQKTYPGEPVTEEQYHRFVEQMAGICGCGGQFKFDAPIRCPQCRSSNTEEGDLLLLYD